MILQLKYFFNYGFDSYKDTMNIGFVLKWIKLDIFDKVINKYNVLFEIVMRDNMINLHIREDNFKWLGRNK